MVDTLGAATESNGDQVHAAVSRPWRRAFVWVVTIPSLLIAGYLGLTGGESVRSAVVSGLFDVITTTIVFYVGASVIDRADAFAQIAGAIGGLRGRRSGGGNG